MLCEGSSCLLICGTEVCQRLKYGNKNVYLGHRRFLPLDHPFRKNTSWFNGKEEMEGPPNVVDGKQIQFECSNIQNELGAAVGVKRGRNDGEKSNWKRRSIFFIYHNGRYN